MEFIMSYRYILLKIKERKKDIFRIEEQCEVLENLKDLSEEKLVISKRRKLDVLSKPPNYHFIWIKSLSRLIHSQVTKHTGSIFLCDRCLAYFEMVKKLE